MDLDQTTELSRVVRWRKSWPMFVLPIRLSSHRWNGVRALSCQIIKYLKIRRKFLD